MLRAEAKMLAFLERTQQKDGSWLPLWFGNQCMPDDANPYYGTAKVLLALAETHRDSAMVQGGLRYLVEHQNTDGGWGRVPIADESGQLRSGSSSVEETAVVVEALSLFCESTREPTTMSPTVSAYQRGLDWLLESVESDRFLQSSPIGLYFAKLWYYEDLYPIIFTASALRRAVERHSVSPTS
jgi:squalene-hopene/tetraprenyl-beta-curcumene cyclase